MATITLMGNAIHTYGNLPAVGSTAPDFHLVDKDLKDVRLADFKGKKNLLTIIPRLAFSVCVISTRKFNEYIKGRKELVVLAISAELPFAQGRFCTSEGLDNVMTLSMMRSRNFAKDYGGLIQDGPLAGITARAVVARDENDRVVYTELVPEIAQEPNYDKALAAL